VVQRGGEERGGGRPGLEAKGLTISAYITRLKGRERVREGPGTGNLLLYTRPEIRMYHSHTHTWVRARERSACRWINSHASGDSIVNDDQFNGKHACVLMR